MSRIGSKIFDLRAQKAMTRKQLGKLIGVSENFIEEVESGKKILNDDLLKRISKVFGQDVNELSLYLIAAEEDENKKSVKAVQKIDQSEIQDIWEGAFGSVLKSVPVYDYSLTKVIETKILPIIANKIESFQKEKVFFLQIEENDMMGFRILKGDIAFCHAVQETENNSICLVEYNKTRLIRQIKKLDASKVLLINNKGSINTETANIKEVKVLARLIKLEISI